MMSAGAVLLLVVTLTSLLACALGGRRGVSRLGAALMILVETVGATMLFFTANVVIGVTLVLAARRLTPYYASLYDVSDLVLLILSLLQAVVFRGVLPPTSQSERASTAASDPSRVS
jgi:hypothetical protein